jgi:hypothetical protein
MWVLVFVQQKCSEPLLEGLLPASSLSRIKGHLPGGIKSFKKCCRLPPWNFPCRNPFQEVAQTVLCPKSFIIELFLIAKC